jgi:hypothetical protein
MATGRIGTTPVLTTRWSKAPAAGTTSLSGLDDNSVSLVYSVGYEAVYQNGVLLSRGNDYTATNGTTITLTTATVAGDIIEVFANQTIPLTDTYTQTVANGKFINNTLTTTTGDIIYASAANTPARLGIGSTDQVLKVSGGVPAWGAAPSAMTLITAQTFTNQSSVIMDNIFTSSYVCYRVDLSWYAATRTDDMQLQARVGTTPSTATTAYTGINFMVSLNGTQSYVGMANTSQWTLANDCGDSSNPATGTLNFARVGDSFSTAGFVHGIIHNSDTGTGGFFSANRDNNTIITGLVLKSSSSNITGYCRVYGLAKS